MRLDERLERELLYSTLVILTFHDYQQEVQDFPWDKVDTDEIVATLRPAVRREEGGWVSDSPRRRVRPEAFVPIFSWARRAGVTIDSIDLDAQLIRIIR